MSFNKYHQIVPYISTLFGQWYCIMGVCYITTVYQWMILDMVDIHMGKQWNHLIVRELIKGYFIILFIERDR